MYASFILSMWERSFHCVRENFAIKSFLLLWYNFELVVTGGQIFRLESASSDICSFVKMISEWCRCIWWFFICYRFKKWCIFLERPLNVIRIFAATPNNNFGKVAKNHDKRYLWEIDFNYFFLKALLLRISDVFFNDFLFK